MLREPPSAAPWRATSAPVRLLHGFFEERTEAAGCWTGRQGAVELDASAEPRFLDFWVLSDFRDLSQELSVVAGGRSALLPLPGGWSPVSVEVPAGEDRVDFAVNKLMPPGRHPGDPRELGVRLRHFAVHADRSRHERIGRQQANAVANLREMLDGAAVVRSTPPSLGIDMYGACNIKPPCVYCGWDASKALEGPFVDAPFTLETLRDWGPFFAHSANLINCSIGEPLMMKNIDDLLDAFAAGNKTLELTTNGQILTERNIEKLVGRPIELYISFDAATPGTYAVLRNARFEQMRANVRRLIDAKGGPGRLPLVNIVFMPMKANVGELDAFVRMCAGLQVDHLVLRPLNYQDDINEVWDRAGYHFDYRQELLPFEELVRTSGRAAELCRRAGVPLADQMDFGGSLGGRFADWYEEGRRSVSPSSAPVAGAAPDGPAEPAGPADAAAAAPEPPPGSDRGPVCGEPWKSLYILRRGVYPCCYGSQPVAPMDEFKDAWNSPVLQAIRRDLSRGRFHRYCLESPACPIVRKAGASRELPVAHELRKRAQRASTRLADYRRRASWARQWAAIRLRRIVTEPGYVRHHVSRLLGRAGRR